MTFSISSWKTISSWCVAFFGAGVAGTLVQAGSDSAINQAFQGLGANDVWSFALSVITALVSIGAGAGYNFYNTKK